MNLKNFGNGPLSLAILVFVFSAISCGADSMVGRVINLMSDLCEIKSAIDETLVRGESSIHIHNGKVITLGLVNTEYNDEEAPERQKAADAVVGILVDRIKDKKEFKNVDMVLVNFIYHEKKFLVVDLTMTVDYYTFDL